MRYSHEETGAAAVVVIVFSVVAAVLAATVGYSGVQLARADPLVQVVHGPWPDIALAFVIGLVALRAARPGRAALVRGLKYALAGATAAAVVIIALRASAGPVLPSFIPAEESARPGIALGVAAGLVEEAVFRLVVLVGAYALLSRRAGPVPATIGAALVTGFLFALSHEVTPAAFDASHFATRMLIPGFVMSVLFLRVGPAFIVTAHCAAHLMIPFAFH